MSKLIIIFILILSYPSLKGQERNYAPTVQELKIRNESRDSLFIYFKKGHKKELKPLNKAIKKKNYEEALSIFYKLCVKYGSHSYFNNLYETLLNKLAEQNQSKYLLKEADKLFEDKKYYKSSFVYLKYVGLNTNDKYALRRMKHSLKFYKSEVKETSNKINYNFYNAIIALADERLNAKSYKDSLFLYKMANKHYPGESYPKKQIVKVKALIKEHNND